MMTRFRTLRNNRERAGFTLIELLVVTAIISILISLLLPAVQMARESARRIQCGHHLKQLSLAAIQHEANYGWYPTGGWSKRWTGLPDKGAGVHQPGGWIYNLLPFIEQARLHELGGSDSANSDHLTQNSLRLQTPISLLHCPSRRSQETYPNVRNFLITNPLATVARNDYAFNGGHRVFLHEEGPDSVAEARTFRWPANHEVTGISFQRSTIRHRDVSDGTSQTLLIAEKHLRKDHYRTGTDHGDNESMYSGDDRDLIRCTGGELDTTFRPLPDSAASAQEGFVFGSAHPHGFQAAFCDGSVKFVSFEISQKIHSRLGSRNDGHSADF